MPDKAVISHRGERYEIGRGRRFYGIWAVGAPYEAPVDRWPENRDGWQQAWSRFATIEAPGTIAPVTRTRKLQWKKSRWRKRPGSSRGGSLLLTGEGLLVLGVVLGLVGLFPAYDGGQSLISQSDQVVSHLIYVIGWAVSAGLIALSVARPGSARLGALLGLGLSTVTFGFFLSDIGEVASGAPLGSGLIISVAGWLACTAGLALALAAEWRDSGGRVSRPVRPQRSHAGPVALLVLAAIGTVAAFAPSWDRYVVTSAVQGTTQTITAGNAFQNPGIVIAGNVAVMVAVIVVALLAALWRPPRPGALLLAGAGLPLAAEVVSALIQVSQPVSPAMFGISNAEATALGLTISPGVTPIFWVFLVFVISLFVSCAWLFTEPAYPAKPGMPAGTWPPVGPGAAGPALREDVNSQEEHDFAEGPVFDEETAFGEGTEFTEGSGGREDAGRHEDVDSATSGTADSGVSAARDSERPVGGGESAYA